MNSNENKSPSRVIRQSRSKSPRHIKPYSKENSSKAPTDINDLRIQAIENRIAKQNASRQTSSADNGEHLLEKLNRELTADEITVKSLKDKLNKSLNQTEFNLMNGDYIYKEHCKEIRRQIQLAKETKIAKIEEMTTELMNKVDDFEKELLEDALKVDKNTFADKIKEMKQENEKWNKSLDEFKVDNQLIDDLRDSVSKVDFQKDALNSQLLKRLLQFKENSDDLVLGEMSIVSLDSMNEINLNKYFNDLIGEYNIECSHENCDCDIDIHDPALEVNLRFIKSSTIMKNGDLFVFGEIENEFEIFVLVLLDLKRNALKKVKKTYGEFSSMATTSDKICLVLFDEDDNFVYNVFNENLEKLHCIIADREKKLVGANDSYLFFIEDTEHDGEISMYDWTLNYVKSIGQNNSPFCNGSRILKFVPIFEKYFFLAESQKEGVHLKIFDEKSGQLLKKIKTDDFAIDRNMNLIINNKRLIKYLSFNGDLLKEFEMHFFLASIRLLLNEKNNLCLMKSDRHGCDKEKQFLLFSWNKYNDETHEVC